MHKIFSPASFIKTQQWIREGVKLVKECKAKGHKIFILSNWDSNSFELLKQRCPSFFALFDGIVISGDVRAIKPDPAIYQHLLDTYSLKADECAFIDDLEENIKAAEQLGIFGIHLRKKQGLVVPWQCKQDYATARKKLAAWEEAFPAFQPV